MFMQRYPRAFVCFVGRVFVSGIGVLLAAVPARAQVACDQIDLSTVHVYNSPADVASWPITTSITQLTMTSTASAPDSYHAGLSLDFSTKDTWPDYTPPGWDGPIEYTVWAVVNINGQWYTSGYIQMWRGRPATGAPLITDFAINWAYDGRWGPMAGHQPVPGEKMGFFVTAGNARGVGTVTSVRERSNVVVVSLPGDDNGVFTFGGTCGYGATILDLNGDGFDDAFLYDKPTGQWIAAINNRNGGFSTTSGKWSPGWDVYPIDLNRDGLTDLFVYDPTSGAWVKVLSAGNGTFTYQTGPWWWTGWKLYPMDLNGDGWADLFGYNPSNGLWIALFIDARGAITYTTGQWWYAWDLYPMDLNGDGIKDLFAYVPGSGGFVKIFNHLNGVFTFESGKWSPGWRVYPTDLNGDGRSDLFLYDPATAYWVKVFVGSGGAFSYASGQWWVGLQVVPVQLNGDGLMDFIVYNKANGAWAKAFGNAGGSFTNTAGTPAWAPGLDILGMDVNGDGKKDVAVYNRLTNTFSAVLAQ
jgi:hypothetical protein